MTIRPLDEIQRELSGALQLREQLALVDSPGRYFELTVDQNEREIAELTSELEAATAVDVEIAVTGAPVDVHSITVPHFQRLLEAVQTVYRALRRELLADGERLSYRDSTLMLSGTSPGSFRAFLRAPAQMELLSEAPADQAFAQLMELLAAAAQPARLEQVARPWAERADQSTLRAVIGLSATLAAGGGTTSIRTRTARGDERRARLTAEDARRLASALVGRAGVEVLAIEGELEMAQETPLRVRVRPRGADPITAAASPDMTDAIKSLLFTEVRAIVQVEMRTSPTSGAPSQTATLLSLDAA